MWAGDVPLLTKYMHTKSGYWQSLLFSRETDLKQLSHDDGIIEVHNARKGSKSISLKTWVFMSLQEKLSASGGKSGL